MKISNGMEDERQQKQPEQAQPSPTADVSIEGPPRTPLENIKKVAKHPVTLSIGATGSFIAGRYVPVPYDLPCIMVSAFCMATVFTAPSFWGKK